MMINRHLPDPNKLHMMKGSTIAHLMRNVKAPGGNPADFAPDMHNSAPGPAGSLYGHGMGTLSILIQNNSGQDVDRFGILKIEGILIDPATNEDSFLNGFPCFGYLPALTDVIADPYVVLCEPCKDGDLASALIAGATPVKVNVSHSDHDYADIIDGDVTKMKSGFFGSARILYKGAGTGDRLAVVQLNSPKYSERMRAIITNSTRIGTRIAWKYDWVEAVLTNNQWSPKLGGRSSSGGGMGQALNHLESMNGSSGLMGNGIDTNNLKGSFSIQPCPTGNTVDLNLEVDTTGAIRPVFTHENAVDGDCDPPS